MGPCDNFRPMRLARLLLLLGLATFAATMLFVPRIAQSQSYHDFADQRRLLAGVPNTLNVVSNAAFIVAAAMGFAAAARADRFRTSAERVDALVFFTGMALTAVGSTIYHLAPSDSTLPYDRAGMTVGFMAFVAMLAHEHLDVGKWLLPALLAIGLGSIGWWMLRDDLRPYGWVQFFPILVLVLIATIGRPRYSGERTTLAIVFAAYGAAKLFETADRSIYAATANLVSGHTLKHLAAACAPVAVSLWIARRTKLAPGNETEAIASAVVR